MKPFKLVLHGNIRVVSPKLLPVDDKASARPSILFQVRLVQLGFNDLIPSFLVGLHIPSRLAAIVPRDGLLLAEFWVPAILGGPRLFAVGGGMFLREATAQWYQVPGWYHGDLGGCTHF